MLKGIASFLLLFLPIILLSQTEPNRLTVEKIMRDPKWIGSSPSAPGWSADSKMLFFNWNPEKAISDSLYYITTESKTPVKASVAQKRNLIFANSLLYNTARSAFVYQKDGDIYYADLKGGGTRRITETIDVETNPQFSFSDSRIVYTRGQNLYAWNIATGETQQLTNLKSGPATSATSTTSTAQTSSSGNQQEAWLKKDQLQYFEVLANPEGEKR